MRPCLRTSAVLVTLVAAVIGCAAPAAERTQPPSPDMTERAPTATPTASPAMATTAQSASGAPSPTPPAEALAPDAVAEVITTALVVRTLPEISDASEILEPYLDAPTLLYIVDGPVSANGYEWYRVQPFGIHYLDFMAQEPPFGWVAAGSREGEEWIELATIECPEPTLDGIRAMSDTARLACYGGEELVLDGVFYGCFVADPAVGTPEWFFQTGCGIVPDEYEAGTVPDPGGLRLRFAHDPGLPHNDPGALVRVTGHFDDPAARTCRSVDMSGDGGGAPEPMTIDEAILYCRSEFVLSDVQVRDP